VSAPAIKPMILTRFGKPFSDPDWLFEVKHDGFRALAYVVEGHCHLVSRRNYVYKSFGSVCESIAADLRVEDAVLDGEIVCLDQNGHSQFNPLMYRRGDPYFYAFDLLWLNGEDLREWTLLIASGRCARSCRDRDRGCCMSTMSSARGEDLFRLTCQRDLEGIVAKWKPGRYMEGERTSWIKIKNRKYSQSIGREKLFVVKRAG
jgi:bifunctional non-homologous end joining protein LigD